MAEENQPEQFSSRLGLILTTIGAAVGTGNIWRFPREAAANGGGAFMIGWLIFLFAWSIPLLMAEFAIGKKTRLGTVGAMRDMAGRNFTWLGIWMMWVGTAVGFYYAVVMGWTIRYFWIAISGEMSAAEDTTQTQALWDNFISSPVEVIFFQLVAVGFSAFIVYNGISGIESYGIHSMATTTKKVGFYEVKMTSVDRFVRDEGIVNVDVLKIDTEGNDALVLLGSIRTIST